MNSPTYPYPPLSQSYKKRYPFRLSVPSFIYPDHYIPNIRRLGPFVDEIELLFLESRHPDSLPSAKDIKLFHQAAQEFDLTYNIHLPTDISVGAESETERRQAVDTLKRVLALVQPLTPTTHTLHIPGESFEAPRTKDPTAISKWQAAVDRSLSSILQTGISSRLISIESLSYPLTRLDPVLKRHNLAICLDIGHLLLYGFDLQAFCDHFEDRITIIHLHGVAAGKDHLALDQLSKEEMARVMGIIKRLQATVSMEVFAYERLERSLRCFASCFCNFSITGNDAIS